MLSPQIEWSFCIRVYASASQNMPSKCLSAPEITGGWSPRSLLLSILREKKLLKLSEVLFNKSLSVCIQTATAAGKNREVFQEKASLTIYSYKL